MDAVITWVDGSDPRHAAKRAYYTVKQREGQQLADAAAPTRFADNSELYYNVQAIRKFAPYVERIYLVTDDQRPHWLSETKQDLYGISLVDHRVIFRGYEQFLPTFSSDTIETMLHRIPGLSDRFLYFNDDVILINPTMESDYFVGHRPVYRGDWFWKVRLKQRLANFLPLSNRFLLKWMGLGFVGYRNEAEHLRRSRLTLFRLAHGPHPLVKSSCDRLFAGPGALEEQLGYRFRNEKQQSPISLAANSELAQGRALKGPRDDGYLSCEGLDTEQAAGWIKLYGQSPWVKSLCVQSLDQAAPGVEEQIISFLKRRLEG